ncbi:MAG: hypothetical protein QM817_32400 [Archangium sp.]
MNESCFVCGAPAVRREMITTGYRPVHQHGGTSSLPTSGPVREMKPLCATCIAKQDVQIAEARARFRRFRAVALTVFAVFFVFALAVMVWMMKAPA